MLKIVLPNNYVNERTYICSVLLTEYLGLNYTIEFNNDINNSCIYYGKKKLEIKDDFFSVPEKYWLSMESMPKEVKHYVSYNSFFSDFLGENNLPIIFGNGEVKFDADNVYLGNDIFGSCFFMLSRYEECVVKKRDTLDRFDYKYSYAHKNGFLDRPIVNEYLELLWCAIKRIYPDVKRKEHEYKVIPTHDIDKPFGILYDSKMQILRHFIGDIVYRRGVRTSCKRLKECLNRLYKPQISVQKGNEVFDFIIRSSKKYDLQDIFFFMNSKKSLLDGNYYVDYPEVKRLMEKVVSTGHKVGLHPSYESYLDFEEIDSECNYMSRILSSISIEGLVGGRQHYLRWRNPATWLAYEHAGLKMDSSLTFAGCAGFRCGVCYRYKVYDLVARKPLNLEEMPLIVMDGTLFEYMKLSKKDALSICCKLAKRCRRYNGNFVFLWHNTMLYDESNREFYLKLLECVVDG